MAEKKLIFTGGRFPDPGIDPVCYNPDFFRLELELESDVLGALRKKNKIKPARISECSPKELADIRNFFQNNRETFYFLFHPRGDLIGSALHIRNYIQSLCISRKYQKAGYGEKLTKYCINKILDNGYSSVELHVLHGNSKAESLYRKLGFVEIR